MNDTSDDHARPVEPEKCIEVTALDKLVSSHEQVVVVDVRSAEEHAAGHIAGAIHIPVDDLPVRKSEVPSTGLVVTACGKGGGRSDRAAALLRSAGWGRVQPLCGGTQAWLSAHAP